MKKQNLANDIAKKLGQGGHIIQPEQEAIWILEHLIPELCPTGELEPTAEQSKLIEQAILDRVEKQRPLAYILGHTPFFDLKIKCEKPILIPRSDTEAWLEQVIQKLQVAKNQNLKILDLCCGTGCIGLAIAQAFPRFKVVGSDINPQAIKLSRENADINKIKNVEFIESDLFQNLNLAEFDMIISNPPYITSEDYQNLEASVKNWEDKLALQADNQGLIFYENIVIEARKCGKQNLIIALEMDPGQITTVQKILNSIGFYTEIIQDLRGQNRAIWATQSCPPKLR